MTQTHKSFVAIIHLLADLVVFNSYSFDQFLKKLLKLLNHLIPVDSCFIYYYDNETGEFILSASKKSHTALIGNSLMKKGEGITGWVADHKKPVVLKNKAYADKRFKIIEQLPEDRYEAFLSVPIIDKTGVVGVINMQNKTPYAFSKDEVTMVEAIVKMIASAFENKALHRQIDTLQTKLNERKVIEKAKGILMKKEKISEEKAYDIIRNEAMKKRKSMKDIAEAILLVFE